MAIPHELISTMRFAGRAVPRILARQIVRRSSGTSLRRVLHIYATQLPEVSGTESRRMGEVLTARLAMLCG